MYVEELKDKNPIRRMMLDKRNIARTRWVIEFYCVLTLHIYVKKNPIRLRTEGVCVRYLFLMYAQIHLHHRLSFFLIDARGTTRFNGNIFN